MEETEARVDAAAEAMTRKIEERLLAERATERVKPAKLGVTCI